MLDFYREDHIKSSRKPHRCHICECEIPIGGSYYRERGKYEGEFFDRCTCKPCAIIRDDYLHFYEVYEYDSDGISCYAQDAVCHDCQELDTCSNQKPLSCPAVKAFYAPKEE